MSVLFMMAAGFMQLLPVELGSAALETRWVQGGYAADAGLQDAMGAMQAALAQGTTMPSTLSGRLGDWTYRVDITGDAQTLRGNSLAVYSLVSVASLDGQAQRRVRVKAVQNSFARYALYSDINGQNGHQGAVLMASSPVNGPIHSNSQVWIGIPTGFYAATGGGSSGGGSSSGSGSGSGDGKDGGGKDGGGKGGKQPPPPKGAGGFNGSAQSSTVPFQGSITQGVSGYRPNPQADGIIYTDDFLSQSDPLAPWSGLTVSDVDARYAQLYTNGRSGVVSGVSPVYMPATIGTLQAAAWGSTASLPPPNAGISVPGGTSKVYLNTDGTSLSGGVYVNADADRVTLSVTDGNPVTTIATGPQTTVITEVTTTPTSGARVGQTVVTTFGQTQVYDNLPNGAIFVEGNIKALSGTYAGRRTVAADVATNKNVYITDNLIRQGDAGTSSLGIVGLNVYLAQNAPSNLTIYGAIYAGRHDDKGSAGTFALQNMGVFKNMKPTPVLNIYGGICEAVEGATGTIGRDSKGNKQTTGYQDGVLVYDPTLTNNPPPFFPAYPKLRVTWYQEDAD